jgi:hypothetical protein
MLKVSALALVAPSETTASTAAAMDAIRFVISLYLCFFVFYLKTNGTSTSASRFSFSCDYRWKSFESLQELTANHQ